MAAALGGQIILPTRPEEVGADILRAELETMGWRVLEQRFPRRAYVVIREPQFIQDLEVNSTGVIFRINPGAAPKEAPRGATPAE